MHMNKRNKQTEPLLKPQQRIHRTCWGDADTLRALFFIRMRVEIILPSGLGENKEISTNIKNQSLSNDLENVGTV